MQFSCGPWKKKWGWRASGPSVLEVCLVISAPFGTSEQTTLMCSGSGELDTVEDLGGASPALTVFATFNFVSLLLSRDETLRAFAFVDSSSHFSSSSSFPSSFLYNVPSSLNVSYSLCLLLTY